MTEVREAPLTAEERRKAGGSMRAFALLALLCAAGGAMCAAMTLGDVRSLGEGIFLVVCGVVAPAAGAALFGWMAWRTGEDVRHGTKVVVRGTVDHLVFSPSVDRTPWRIRVGSVPASDCLFPDPSLMTELRLGLRVEVTYLPRSGRTLRVRPI